MQYEIEQVAVSVQVGVLACFVSLNVGDQLLKARVTSDAARELDLREGRSIYALIKSVALDIFAAR